jgi:hypothetical protein
MKIHLPPAFFQQNKLKEIYYKSFIVKNTVEKFDTSFQQGLPVVSTTETEITLMNIKWGATKKNVVRILGAPRFVCQVSTHERKVVLFFKQEILGEKAIIQCHFLKDQFYYAHIDFVASLSKENKKVQEMVKHRYLRSHIGTDRSLIITDPTNNKLILEHNVYLHLDYLTGKPALLKKLREGDFDDLQRNNTSKDVKHQWLLQL